MAQYLFYGGKKVFEYSVAYSITSFVRHDSRNGNYDIQVELAK